ncbi:alpha/beta hydrolase [Saccharibacillus alkalitolerans]|uniref:Alpha/beta hydrolase n=1 Tax=Saccharibacillus alkalitolerans TaxID=2705290 RepID=A0ABX0F9K4_9BACL|nr:alpha/beta hydrolase [Saccharibacillus alkalitolerans]NGZ74697.1 alpha/beta hydrolase [Saccharibacillus alkalitolerans]
MSERSTLTRFQAPDYADMPYHHESAAQKLDIYLPRQRRSEGAAPVIVSIHGGAFKEGDKADSQVYPVLKSLERGYAVVSINYRLSGEAKFPAQIHDVKTAIRWVKSNADKYGFDKKKIAVWGASAGGHLAALAGTSGRNRVLEDTSTGEENVDPCVQAVVDWFGPTDFLSMDQLFMESEVRSLQNHAAPDSPESLLLGRPIGEAPHLARAANPEMHITPGAPPFYIQHGTLDPLIPVRQSVLLADKLEVAIGGGNVRLELLEGAGHGGPEFESSENVEKILDFLDEVLHN